MSKNLLFASGTVWILSASSTEALHSSSSSHISWFSCSGSSNTPRFRAIPYPRNCHVGHTSSQAEQKSGEQWSGRDSPGPVLRWPLLSSAKSLIIPLQEERQLGVLLTSLKEEEPWLNTPMRSALWWLEVNWMLLPCLMPSTKGCLTTLRKS